MIRLLSTMTTSSKICFRFSSSGVVQTPSTVEKSAKSKTKKKASNSKKRTLFYAKMKLKNQNDLKPFQSSILKTHSFRNIDGILIDTKKKSLSFKDSAKITMNDRENTEKVVSNNGNRRRDGPMTMATFAGYVEACIESRNLDLAVKSLFLAKIQVDYIPLPVFDLLLRALIYDKTQFKRIWKVLSSQEDNCITHPGILVSLAAHLGHHNIKPSDFFLSSKAMLTIVSTINTREFFRQATYLDETNRKYFTAGISTLGITADTNDVNSKNTTRYSRQLLKELNSGDESKLRSQLWDGNNSATMDSLKSEIKDQWSRQISTELRGYEIIGSIVPENTTNSSIKTVEAVRDELCQEWILKITKSLEAQIKTLKNADSRVKFMDCLSVYPFLSVLPVEQYARVAVEETSRLLSESESYCPSVFVIQYNLGKKMFRRIQVERLSKQEHMDDLKKSYFEYLDWFLAPKRYWCHREAIEGFNRCRRNLETPVQEWTGLIEVAIGRELLKQIMNNVMVTLDKNGHVLFDDSSKSLKFGGDGIVVKDCTDDDCKPSTCPGLYKIYRQRRFSQVEEIKPHPNLAKLFSYAKLSSLKFSTTELPLLVPPLPWISPKRGGYLITSSDFVRINEDDGGIKVDPLTDVDPIMDALNQLGSTPWIVNKKILDVAITLFNTNLEEYKELQRVLDVPQHPDRLPAPELDPEIQKKIHSNTSLNDFELEIYKKHNMNKQVYSRIKSENYSLWCDSLYRLSLASHFRNDVLYFPHNIDFRGRVYPIPPHFNHMGGDLSRSLLIFAKGQPLGPNGLTWLKLHVVNLFGTKKRDSIKDRLKYADEVMDEILDSASDPLNGRRWWTLSDEPWQTLSTCMEIKAVLESGDPENYICHVPIHQDGSCNGLQHYAAIGRDVLGARSVNLIPSSVPQDVYSEIASLVEQKRMQESLDPSLSSYKIAKSLEGFVTRKVIKQTVMTTVYGVTKYGARLQIARQLKDIDEFPSDLVEEASKYLTKKTFDSLNELFTASQEIQLWLTESANVIAKVYGQNVEWETPLGLKVVQPYKKVMGTSIKTMSLWSQPSAKRIKINSTKQRNGFPPNFIHSLDSTHMMLTALHLWKEGVTYASVHDCYWTHPNTVEIMNETCRRQFINLHSEPILEDLSQSFIKRYSKQTKYRVEAAKANMLFRSIPTKGDLDLDVVKDSVFFFS